MSCPPGTYLAGYLPDGSPDCQPITGLARPATIPQRGVIPGSRPTLTPVVPLIQPARPFPTISKPADFPFPPSPGEPGGPPIILPPIFVDITVDLGPLLAGIEAGLNSVQGNILDALTKQTQGIQDSIGSLASGITDALGGLVNKLGDFLDSAFGALADQLAGVVSKIGNVIGDIITALVSGIKDALYFLADVVGTITSAIHDEITNLIQAIKDNGAAAIIPVLQLIAQGTYAIVQVIAAIENDIKGGIVSLLQLPIQIHDSLASLEASINRALQEIGIKSAYGSTTGVVFDERPLPNAWINQFAESAASPGLWQSIGNLFPSIAPSLSTCTDPTMLESIEKIRRDAEHLPVWVKWIFWGLADFAITATSSVAVVKKVIQLGDETVNRLCPVTVLDPTNVAQAKLRGFYSANQAKEDLSAQGFNAARISVIEKLATNRLDVGVLLGGVFRGDISLDTFYSDMAALGFTQEQANIIKAGAQTIPTVNDVLRWRDYKLIDDETTKALLTVLRYTPEFQRNILNSYQQPETAAQEVALDGRKSAFKLGFMAETVHAATPQEVLDAAQRDQITTGNVRNQWLAHFAIPSYALFIQSYFRNLRGLDTVHHAMQTENIPAEFWDELIRLQRPLIPFRSMGAFLNSGAMTEAEVIFELSSHGFDPLHIKWMLTFFAKEKKAATATAVSGLGALSIQTAKGLFLDGAITEEQYIQVLVEHKFTPELAKTFADAEQLAAHAADRKRRISEFVDEVLVGAETVDEIIAQMHQQGFTQQEILTFQSRVRHQKAITSKRPTIADMKIFLKAQLITLQQFKNELQLQGWGQPWLDAFVALETPPATP